MSEGGLFFDVPESLDRINQSARALGVSFPSRRNTRDGRLLPVWDDVSWEDGDRVLAEALRMAEDDGDSKGIRDISWLRDAWRKQCGP